MNDERPTWPIEAYGTILRGDETTSEDQIGSACSPEVARRLAACWNACRGVPLEEVERWADLRTLLVQSPDAKTPADTVARLIERERIAPLMQAVEWLLDDGHMNQEHLARLRAAWETAGAFSHDGNDRGNGATNDVGVSPEGS